MVKMVDFISIKKKYLNRQVQVIRISYQIRMTT